MDNLDIACIGLAVGNICVRPVNKNIFNADVTQVETIESLPGGDALNQSIVLARLGDKPVLLSKMADDDFGNSLCDALEQNGVETGYIAKTGEEGTSVCIILIQEDGQRNFCTYKGALRSFSTKDIALDAIDYCKIVSIGGLMALPYFDRSGAKEILQYAKGKGKITVVDTKYDSFHIGYQGINGLLQYTDYFFPSYDEAAYLSGEKETEKIADFFLSEGAKHVGIKLGGDGAYIKDEQFNEIIPCFQGNVVDTTGAGDNFMAGFLHGILKGWTMKECALFGNATGAVCVSKVGANTAVTDSAVVYKVLKTTWDGRDLLAKIIR